MLDIEVFVLYQNERVVMHQKFTVIALYVAKQVNYLPYFVPSYCTVKDLLLCWQNERVVRNQKLTV